MKAALAMILLLLLSSSAFGLTPAERKLVLKAKAEVKAAKAAVKAAQVENDEAWDSAEQADSRALTAQHQAEVEHTNLVKAVTLVDEWRPKIEQDKRWFGLGRIVFGLADLAKHLLLLAAAIAILAVVFWILQMFPWFAWLRPALAVILFVPKRLLASFTKPKAA
jgi:hypothetical protein